MGTMHSIKKVNIDGRREKCNKILWTAIIKWGGRCIKEKKQETTSRLISTFIHCKECDEYVTFPHRTAANMTEGWTLLVVLYQKTAKSVWILHVSSWTACPVVALGLNPLVLCAGLCTDIFIFSSLEGNCLLHKWVTELHLSVNILLTFPLI
jgi:hypothetical protein